MSTLKILLVGTIASIGSMSSPAAAKTIKVPADHGTIQDAIDAAAVGDTVLVASGTYRERIRLKQAITVKSSGDDSKGKLGLRRAEVTIIDGGGQRESGPGVSMAAGSTIDGFTVTNVGTFDEASWDKHHATQGNEQSHEHIGQPGTPGISVIGVSCAVTNNIVHHVGYTGIAIQSADGKACSPHIYRNVCFRNMGGGIGSMMKSTAIIEDNICYQNFYAGIGHDDASPTVINNTCYENIRAGIGISHGSCPIVQGNRCYRNRRAGIGTRTGATTRPLIIDNDCYENDMAGIGTEAEAAPTIRNNRCYRNRLAGIGARTRATPTIVGNECYENQKVGIGQQSDAVTVLIDNHCHHNQAAGIGFDPCTNGRSTVSNNRVIDNALVAVGIHEGWAVHLSGNKLSRNGGLPPIVMIFDGAQASLIDNVIQGGGVAGIRVAGQANVVRNEFVGEKMRPGGPPNFAVWALPGSTVTMTENKIHRWRHGLHASEANIAATKNIIADFHRTAIVVQKPSSPADVFGNLAITTNNDDKVLELDGDAGLVANNEVRAAEAKPAP